MPRHVVGLITLYLLVGAWACSTKKKADPSSSDHPLPRGKDACWVLDAYHLGLAGGECGSLLLGGETRRHLTFHEGKARFRRDDVAGSFAYTCKGMQIIADNGLSGRYDPATGTLHWRDEELKRRGMKMIEVPEVDRAAKAKDRKGLVKLLGTGAPHTRLAAGVALARLAPAAASSPLGREKDPWVRAAVVAGLTPDKPGVTPLLKQALGDRSAWVRAAALAVLTKKKAASLLAGAVKDRDAGVRHAALQGLLIGPRGPTILRAAATLSGDTCARIRREAVSHLFGLSDHGPRGGALGTVADLVAGKKVSDGRGAELALRYFVEGLEAEEPPVRRVAACAIGGLGGKALSAAPTLRRLTKQGTDAQRRCARTSLDKILDPKLDVAAEGRRLRDTRRTAKDLADSARRLGYLERRAAPAIPALMGLLSNKAYGPRKAAAEALGRIGADEAITPLIERIKDSSDEVRTAALVALGRIAARTSADGARKRVLSTLRAALGSKDLHMQVSAAAALAEMGPRAAPAVPAMGALLTSSTWWARKVTADALRRLGPTAVAAVPHLEKALLDGQVHQQDMQVRLAVLNALVAIGPGAVGALVKAVTDEKAPPWIRASAAVGLGRVGPGARAAIPALEKAARGDAKQLRPIAAAALKRIRGEP